MCLAVPGRVVSIQGEALNRMGRVSFGGIIKEVSLAYVPDVDIDDYVIVHVGFAISQLDPHEAKETLNYLERIAEQGRKKTTATPLH